MDKKERDFEKAFAVMEKERLLIDKKRSLLSFEMAFFFPLFALLFLVTSFAEGSSIKFFFFFATIALIFVDIIYSCLIYYEIRKKQKELDNIIEKKLL